ncbi:hypothetical protein [Phytoactinopolyspora limicola]|uniref:hypothetical protein n=1 Tax=Phytoactinopolyspora limicola TaxID=2715536 RepID=UPI001408D94F|nr:hypothetical protein [Phytoactinopolyspora limicola]
MTGTTPGGDREQEPHNDPFGQKPERSASARSWRNGMSDAWRSGGVSGPDGQTITAPKPIRTAVKLMYVGAVLHTFMFVLGLFSRDDIERAILDADNSDRTPEEIDAAISMTYTLNVAIPVIAVILWLWLASANRKGRSWARVVATILGALNILFAVLGLAGTGLGAGALIGLISPALAAVILYQLYRPESSEYYRWMSAKPY